MLHVLLVQWTQIPQYVWDKKIDRQMTLKEIFVNGVEVKSLPSPK